MQTAGSKLHISAILRYPPTLEVRVPHIASGITTGCMCGWQLYFSSQDVSEDNSALAADSVLDTMRFSLFGLKLIIEVEFFPKHLPNAGHRKQFLQLSTQHLGPHP